LRCFERRIILDVVDSQWKDHLLSLDISKKHWPARLRQKDPLVEFKKEAFVLFEDMMPHRQRNHPLPFHIQMQQADGIPTRCKSS